MEKYSQFRDRGKPYHFVATYWPADWRAGSGIAPFFPVPTQPSGVYILFHVFLFCFRLPFEIFFVLAYFLVLQWLPIGSLGKKASLWTIIGLPGIWWIDLQIDGVRRGYYAQYSSSLPC
jgi:1-acylglycerol-3-phosphate O-acyltransferase